MFLGKVLLQLIKNWFQDFRLGRVTCNHVKGADRSVKFQTSTIRQWDFIRCQQDVYPKIWLSNKSGRQPLAGKPILALFNCNPKSFLNCCYIVNETQVHYFDDESKRQSQPSCNFMLQLSTSKIMITVFFFLILKQF